LVDLSFESVQDPDTKKYSLKPVTSTGGKHLPLIKLHLSEYGPPCVLDTEENSYPDKEEYLLSKKEINIGCRTEIAENTTSPLYRLVKGFPNVTEE
jgi:hypothetical protein